MRRPDDPEVWKQNLSCDANPCSQNGAASSALASRERDDRMTIVLHAAKGKPLRKWPPLES